MKKGPDVFLEGRAHHNSRCKFSHHGVTRPSVVMAAEAADEAARLSGRRKLKAFAAAQELLGWVAALPLLLRQVPMATPMGRAPATGCC